MTCNEAFEFLWAESAKVTAEAGVDINNPEQKFTYDAVRLKEGLRNMFEAGWEAGRAEGATPSE